MQTRRIAEALLRERRIHRRDPAFFFRPEVTKLLKNFYVVCYNSSDTGNEGQHSSSGGVPAWFLFALSGVNFIQSTDRSILPAAAYWSLFM